MSLFQTHLVGSGRPQTQGNWVQMPPQHRWRRHRNRRLGKWLVCRTFLRKREEEVTFNVSFDTMRKTIIRSVVKRGLSTKILFLRLHYCQVQDCWKFYVLFYSKTRANKNMCVWNNMTKCKAQNAIFGIAVSRKMSLSITSSAPSGTAWTLYRIFVSGMGRGKGEGSRPRFQFWLKQQPALQPWVHIFNNPRLRFCCFLLVGCPPPPSPSTMRLYRLKWDADV